MSGVKSKYLKKQRTTGSMARGWRKKKKQAKVNER